MPFIMEKMSPYQGEQPPLLLCFLIFCHNLQKFPNSPNHLPDADVLQSRTMTNLKSS